MKVTNKLKRFISLLLALLMLFLIAGCKSQKEDNTSSDEYEYVEEVISEVVEKTEYTSDPVASGSSAITGSKTETPKINGSTVKVLLWYEPSKSETRIKEEFEKKTGCKVQFIKTSLANYQTKLASLVATGAAPDSAAMPVSGYPSAVINGLFDELPTQYFNLNNKLWDIKTMDNYKWKDNYYGVVAKGSTMGDFYLVYFNQTLFEERGVETPYEVWKANPDNWNWNKLVELSKKMTYGNGDDKMYGLICDYAGTFLWSTGKDFVSVNNGKITNTCQDAKVKEAWKFFCNLRDVEKVLYPVNSSENDFINRKGAMYIGGSWLLQADQSFNKNVKDDWGAVPFPKQNNGSYYAPFRANLWGVGKGAKNPAGSAAFLSYWLDPAHYNTKELYAQPQFRDIHQWMWNQEKGNCYSNGVLNAKEKSYYQDLWVKLTAGAGQVDTVLAQESNVIDESIKIVLDARK